MIEQRPHVGSHDRHRGVPWFTDWQGAGGGSKNNAFNSGHGRRDRAHRLRGARTWADLSRNIKVHEHFSTT